MLKYATLPLITAQTSVKVFLACHSSTIPRTQLMYLARRMFSTELKIMKHQHPNVKVTVGTALTGDAQQSMSKEVVNVAPKLPTLSFVR